MKDTPGLRESNRGSIYLKGSMPGVISKTGFRSLWNLRWLLVKKLTGLLWASVDLTVEAKAGGKKSMVGVPTGQETPGQNAGGLRQGSCLLGCLQDRLTRNLPAGMPLTLDRRDPYSVPTPSATGNSGVGARKENKLNRTQKRPPPVNLELRDSKLITDMWMKCGVHGINWVVPRSQEHEFRVR